MSYSLSWLSKVLSDSGCLVEELPGWLTRGHGDMNTVKGILCHHTAGSKKGDAPSLQICKDGRPDLPGPLSQLVLGRSGLFYVVAAGKSYHAGKGSWKPMGLVDNGNSRLIGIEAENTGLDNDQPWPEEQIAAYAKGCVAMLKYLKLPVDAVIGHKEYAPGRKSDPSFDMNKFRAVIRSLM